MRDCGLDKSSYKVSHTKENGCNFVYNVNSFSPNNFLCILYNSSRKCRDDEYMVDEHWYNLGTLEREFHVYSFD